MLHASGVNGCVGTAAALSAADNGHGIWQGHESMFFAWYDPDGDGAMRKQRMRLRSSMIRMTMSWRIANKVFDTFSDIILSAEDASRP